MRFFAMRISVVTVRSIPLMLLALLQKYEKGMAVWDETPILWPPQQRADSFEKTLMLEKIESRRRR